jgi:hypothetical protein
MNLLAPFSRILVLAAFAVWSAAASAAIIGARDDWKPLRAGASQLGISSAMVDGILAAGVQVSCPGTVHDNGGVLNGWLLQGDPMSVYTNAHGIVDIGGRDRRPYFVEPLDRCEARSFRNLAIGGAKGTPSLFSIPADRQQLELSSFLPQSDAPTKDRARLHLLRPIPGTGPLAIPEFDPRTLVSGGQVFMVSLRPPNMREVEIQACHMKQIVFGGAQPGELLTDCDNSYGNSAALYFIRDPANPTMLLPVAMHGGSIDKLGDYQPWSREKNTAVAILLEHSFFAIGGRR